jgi:hypothetical protein
MRVKHFGEKVGLRADDCFMGWKDMIAAKNQEVAVLGVRPQTVGQFSLAYV